LIALLPSNLYVSPQTDKAIVRQCHSRYPSELTMYTLRLPPEARRFRGIAETTRGPEAIYYAKPLHRQTAYA
jgi:hypothetical protein